MRHTSHYPSILMCIIARCSFCSRDIYGRGCFCPKVVDNAMILCSSCERYQRGGCSSFYPAESSDTIVVETLRNSTGWEIAPEYDEKPVDARLVCLGITMGTASGVGLGATR